MRFRFDFINYRFWFSLKLRDFSVNNIYFRLWFELRDFLLDERRNFNRYDIILRDRLCFCTKLLTFGLFRPNIHEPVEFLDPCWLKFLLRLGLFLNQRRQQYIVLLRLRLGFLLEQCCAKERHLLTIPQRERHQLINALHESRRIIRHLSLKNH